MENLKILTEQQFLEQLEFIQNIPPDVKTSVIFYVQHKNLSFNPYLYSAILRTLDSVPDKKIVKASEVVETAYKISEKYTIIENDKYEDSDEEKKYEKSENELPKNDPLQEEKVDNILAFASSIEAAYETLTAEQKNTVDTAFDTFVFNEDESDPFSQLRKMVKDKDVTEEDLLKFLDSQGKDDQFFKLLRTIYVRNNKDKKIFEKNYNKIVRILAGQKVTYKDISMDIFVDILKKRREEFNLAESDLVFDKNIQTSKHFKKENVEQDCKIFFENLESIPELHSIASQFRDSILQLPMSYHEISHQKIPISDAELGFEARAETLNVDLTSFELTSSLDLDGFSEFLGMYHDAPIPNEEDTEKKQKNQNGQKKEQQNDNEKTKYSLKDRITGFFNIFVKKQNKLPNASIKRTSSSHTTTKSLLNEEHSGILDVFKKGLQSLGTLFKHNDEKNQTDSMSHSYVNTQNNFDNIFTSGITPDTLTQIEAVEKSYAKKSILHSHSTPIPNNNITNEFEEH